MPTLTPIAAAPSETAPTPPPGAGSPSGGQAAPGFAHALQRQSAAPGADTRGSDGDRPAAPPAEAPPAAAACALARPTNPHAGVGCAARRNAARELPLASTAPADPGGAGAALEATPAAGRAAAPAADEGGEAAPDSAAPALSELLAWLANLALAGTAAAVSPEPARAAGSESGAAPGGAAAAPAAAVAGLVPARSALAAGGASAAATPGPTRADAPADAPGASTTTAQAPLAAMRRGEGAAASDASAAAAPARPPREQALPPAAAWLPQPGAAAQEPRAHSAAEPARSVDSATAAALPGALAVPPRLPEPPAAATAQAELPERVGSDAFAPALGSRLALLVRDGIEHAQLRLNPAELGPIDVRIRLDGTQAQVDFSAAHAHTRQALQEAVPVLAGALREAGLTLAGGGVFEQARDAQPQPRHDAPPRAGGRHDDAGTPAAAAPAAAARPARARGVVDLYA